MLLPKQLFYFFILIGWICLFVPGTICNPGTSLARNAVRQTIGLRHYVSIATFYMPEINLLESNLFEQNELQSEQQFNHSPKNQKSKNNQMNKIPGKRNPNAENQKKIEVTIPFENIKIPENIKNVGMLQKPNRLIEGGENLSEYAANILILRRVLIRYNNKSEFRGYLCQSK